MKNSTHMSRRTALATAAGALLGLTLPADAAPAPDAAKKPQVEVVFCLDTTGSMGGLIEGAKQKIWAICNQIASGKPIPTLKVGLVAFRDRGDQYITKVFDLSDDLDGIHGHLRSFQAGGGGDGPESVNQALHDSVHKIKWSTDKNTLRIIFLVGDAPPHMDYADDVKYPETCKKACEKGIIINTIQCGNMAETVTFWKDICTKAEGSYVQIAQDGGVTPVVATPFDKRLAEINGELATSVLVYGGDRERADGAAKTKAARGLAAPAAAERAAFQAKNAQAAAYDLLDNVKQNKVKLEDLKKDQLPKELQGKPLAEQKKVLADLDKKRDGLRKEAIELDKKRSDYIAKQQAEGAKKGKAGFDGQVLDILRKQAARTNIQY